MPLVLLRPNFLSLRNRYRYDRTMRSTQKDLLLVFMALLTMTCVYAAFALLFWNLKDNQLFIALIPGKIIELVYYAFFFILLISSTIAAISNIYNAENMDLLLIIPVSKFRLYIIKIIHIGMESCAMLFVLGIPVGLAYITALDIHPSFILTGVLASLPFVCIPIGLSIVTATIFVKLISKFWHRGAFLIGALAIALMYVIHQFSNLLKNVQPGDQGTTVLTRTISLFENPNPTWLPSSWVADILTAYTGNPLEDLYIKITLLVATALGSLGCGYLFFDYFTLSVRSSNCSTQTGKNARSTDISRRLLDFACHKLHVEPQIRSMIIKDLTSLIRDQGQSFQLIMFLSISIAYIALFKISSIGLELSGATAQDIWVAFLACMNFLFVGCILTAMMTRLVYPSVSLEGRAFWIMLVSPIPLKKLVDAKYQCWIPLTASYSSLLFISGGIALNVDYISLFILGIIGASLAIGVTGLAIGLGSIFAIFEWESPNQVSTGLGTLVLFLSSLALIVLLFAPASIAISTTISIKILVYMAIMCLKQVSIPITLNTALFTSRLIQFISLSTFIFANLAIAHMARSYGAKSLARNSF